MTEYQYDWVDGKRMPPLVVTEDYVLTGIHQGSVHVEGGRFTLDGVLQGSLHIHPGASAEIRGIQQGSVHIDVGCSIEVAGAVEGSTHVEPGGRVEVEASGKLAGSLHNDGLIVLRGVFGGSVTGKGEMRIEGNGRIKQPTIQGGVSFYDWSDSPSITSRVAASSETGPAEGKNVKIKTLRFSGLDLEPYVYEEDAEDGLIIRAKVRIGPAEQDRLFELKREGEFMSVERIGVSDEPLRMRLGRCLWSQDGDMIKQEVNLVDEVWDKKNDRSSWLARVDEPFRSRTKELVAEKAEQLDRLVGALVKSAVITQDQAREVLNVPEESLWLRDRSFLRVDDLDSFED